jgi:SPP1 gp7 family putative phage head morphogenesis protein
MDAFENAVSLGFVTVARTSGGYIVRGAENDLLVLSELKELGAVWREHERGFFVATEDRRGRLESLRRKSNAALTALAARHALAREQGVKLFDNQRERQQRKITREIKAVYQLAMAEHSAQIKQVSELLQQGKPDGMDAKEWAAITARRKNTLAELESVYDGLAEGLANAGASAQRLTNAQLAESAAISRRVAAWQLDNMSGVNVSRFLAHDTASLALTGITSFHGKYDLKAWEGVSDKRKARATIKNAVARGLLTGEHPEAIARRIQGIYSGEEAGSPHKRAVRIARTETNRVMSEATQEAIRSANALGVKVRNRWDATLDSRTRDSHREVDGEVREVGEKFSNGLRRPGDGGPADSINCRCCITPVLEGFEPDSRVRRDNETGELIPYMTYREWESKRGVSMV